MPTEHVRGLKAQGRVVAPPFDLHSTAAVRGRFTLTYEDLSLLMFRRRAAGVLDDTLGHIAFIVSTMTYRRLPQLSWANIAVGLAPTSLSIPRPSTRNGRRSIAATGTISGPLRKVN